MIHQRRRRAPGRAAAMPTCQLSHYSASTSGSTPIATPLHWSVEVPHHKSASPILHLRKCRRATIAPIGSVCACRQRFYTTVMTGSLQWLITVLSCFASSRRQPFRTRLVHHFFACSCIVWHEAMRLCRNWGRGYVPAFSRPANPTDESRRCRRISRRTSRVIGCTCGIFRTCLRCGFDNAGTRSRGCGPVGHSHTAVRLVPPIMHRIAGRSRFCCGMLCIMIHVCDGLI
jgi:hypothetical protein